MIACFSLNACQEVTSRLTWSFARDNALLGSKYLSKVDSNLKVPVWALIANAAVIFIIGCIYLGSSTAFNAFIGSGLLLQQCSFAIPAALLLWHGRSEKVLPSSRSVKLGIFGWVANVATLLFAPTITVFYCLPVTMPVTSSSMSKFHFVGFSTEDTFRWDANKNVRLCLCCDWSHVHICCSQLVSPCSKCIPRPASPCISRLGI